MAKKEKQPPENFKLLKGIPEQTYNQLVDYLVRQEYRQVAGMIDGLGRAIDVKVTPEKKSASTQ